METQPFDPLLLQTIQWLRDELQTQEDLLYSRVDYILKQIAARFGGEIKSWRVLGSSDGQTIKDCINENLVSWYSIEWKGQRPRSMAIQINGQLLLLDCEFPTRWLTQNFEEELERLTSENSL